MAESKTDEGTLLEKLKKSFFRGSVINDIKPDDVNLMTWDWQEKFLNATVNSDLMKKYPMSKQFLRLFFKNIIKCLEAKQEVHDDFYSNLCLAMNRDEKDCYKHYLINEKSDIITIKETNLMVVHGTTGMRTWEGSIILAEWAFCNKEVFMDKTILELGSGLGYASIAVGKLCQPKTIYLTDCHHKVLELIHGNIRINFPRSEVTQIQDVMLFKNDGRTIGVLPLDWNNRIEELPSNIVPDVVIGSDLVFDPVLLQPLCGVITALFERNKYLEIYIMNVIRNEDTFKDFLKCLGTMNLTYQRLLLDRKFYMKWDLHESDTCLLKISKTY